MQAYTCIYPCVCVYTRVSRVGWRRRALPFLCRMVLPIRSAYHRRLLAVRLGLPTCCESHFGVCGNASSFRPVQVAPSQGFAFPWRKSDSLSVLLAVREENCLLAGMGGLSLASRTSSEFRRVQCKLATSGAVSALGFLGDVACPVESEDGE